MEHRLRGRAIAELASNHLHRHQLITFVERDHHRFGANHDTHTPVVPSHLLGRFADAIEAAAVA